MPSASPRSPSGAHTPVPAARLLPHSLLTVTSVLSRQSLLELTCRGQYPQQAQNWHFRAPPCGGRGRRPEVSLSQWHVHSAGGAEAWGCIGRQHGAKGCCWHLGIICHPNIPAPAPCPEPRPPARKVTPADEPSPLVSKCSLGRFEKACWKFYLLDVVLKYHKYITYTQRTGEKKL